MREFELVVFPIWFMLFGIWLLAVVIGRKPEKPVSLGAFYILGTWNAVILFYELWRLFV